MMNPTIHNLIFDLGGVLYDLDIDGCMQAFEQAGATDVRRLVSSTDKAGVFQAYETGEISTSRFREELRRLVTVPLTDEAIDRMWNSMLVRLPQQKLDLLRELGKRYNIYLLSNTNELHWEYVVQQAFTAKGQQVSDFFRQVFLSFRMKQAKPDPDIFLNALQTAGLKAEETLFIDDSPVNCRAAESVGMRSVHYTPGQDLRSSVETAL